MLMIMVMVLNSAFSLLMCSSCLWPPRHKMTPASCLLTTSTTVIVLSRCYTLTLSTNAPAVETLSPLIAVLTSALCSA